MAQTFRIAALAILFASLATALMAQTQSALRGSTPLDTEGPAARMTPTRALPPISLVAKR